MKKEKNISLSVSLLPVFVLLLTGALSVFKWKIGMLFPLISSVITTSIIAFLTGKKWSDLEKGLTKGISVVLQPVMILIIVGSIIGTWIASGTIPTIIFYGLKFISPAIFIPLTAVLTAVVSTSIGTSFTSIATVGIALMAVGNGMGFPAPLTASAVISGAFFGDKISPLSDTTNIAPAIAGCDLFEHVAHMLWDTVPAFLISLIIYYFINLKYAAATLTETATVNSLIIGLEEAFYITPVLLILPLFTIFLAARKKPAVPTLMSVSLIGAFAALVFQNSSLNQALSAFTFGYSSETGISMLDTMLSKGGITSMGGTIILMVTAASLGGLMKETGVLDTILNKVMTMIKKDSHLNLAALFSSFFVGFTTGAQMLAIIIPGNLFAASFSEHNLHSKNLSRAVESGGTLGITLVPWSVPAIFASSMLGVRPIEFIPFLFFPMLVLLFNIFYSITGISITKIDKNKSAERKKLKTALSEKL